MASECACCPGYESCLNVPPPPPGFEEAPPPPPPPTPQQRKKLVDFVMGLSPQPKGEW